MKTVVISLSGNNPSISTQLHPEIELDERFEYSCSLLDFTIQNISMLRAFNGNESLRYTRPDGDFRKITIHRGEHSVPHIMRELPMHMELSGFKASILFDKYKMKFRVKTSVEIDFTVPDSVGEIMGFEPQKLDPDTTTEAEYSVRQFNVETIRINCDLVDGSIHDGMRTHTIHEFIPKPVSDYKMYEQPQHLIYLPVIRHRINSVNITVTDQSGELLDLKGGEIRCRLIITRNN